MRLWYKGSGQIWHDSMMTRWNRKDDGTWYGVWSERKDKWILIIFIKD